MLSSAEVVTFNITHLKVKFNQAVYDPVGDSDPDDVTNPNNYILIRDLGDTPGVQTISCVAGADVPADTNIAIGTVTYDSETSVATFTINGGRAALEWRLSPVRLRYHFHRGPVEQCPRIGGKQWAARYGFPRQLHGQDHE